MQLLIRWGVEVPRDHNGTSSRLQGSNPAAYSLHTAQHSTAQTTMKVSTWPETEHTHISTVATDRATVAIDGTWHCTSFRQKGRYRAGILHQKRGRCCACIGPGCGCCCCAAAPFPLFPQPEPTCICLARISGDAWSKCVLTNHTSTTPSPCCCCCCCC
jgi:hypothetical protein